MVSDSIRINGKPVHCRLTKPPTSTSAGIILLPGADGGALSERYLPLETAVLSAGFMMLRYDAWDSKESLHNQSLNDISAGIGSAILFMKDHGCNWIGFVGKSIGGGILLTHVDPRINAQVLWAPAIGIGNVSTIESSRSKKLCEFDKIFDITINDADLAKVISPTLLIHGDKDPKVPLEQSEHILSRLPHGSIAVIAGADHSYRTEEEMEAVVSKTVEFFTQHLNQRIE